MSFLDDLTNLLGGAASSAQSGFGAMPNFGAAPAMPNPSPAPAPAPLAGNVLARLNKPAQTGAQPGPLGINPSPLGGNMAASLAGLSRVDPHASRFGAFAQGLAGGMASQLEAQSRDQQLAVSQRQADLEALFKGAQIQNLQTQLTSRQNSADTLRRLLPGGGSAGGSAPSSNVPAPVGERPADAQPQPAAPVAVPASTLGSSGPAAPAPGPTPASADGSASPVKMIPHGLARSPDFWATVEPESNPAVLNKKAEAYEAAAAAAANDPETAKRYGDTANQYRMRAGNIRREGLVTLNDGSTALVPGFAHSKAMVAAIVKAAEAGVADQHDLVKIQPQLGGPEMYTTRAAILAQNGQGGAAPGSPVPAPGAQPAGVPPAPVGALPAAPTAGGPQGAGASPGVVAQQPAFVGERQKKIADDEASMAQQFQKRQVARDRLQTMIGILQDYEPGAGAEQKADFIARLRSMGFSPPTGKAWDPAKFQEFVKYASANVLSDVQETSGNSQPLVSEMEAIKKANANPELQPAAVAALLSHSLGVLDYKDAHYRAYNDWRGKNPYATGTGDFETSWAKDNPISKYTEPVVKGMAYQGQDIPEAAQRKAGQTYMTPKGPLVWQGTGWSRPPAATQ